MVDTTETASYTIWSISIIPSQYAFRLITLYLEDISRSILIAPSRYLTYVFSPQELIADILLLTETGEKISII